MFSVVKFFVAMAMLLFATSAMSKDVHILLLQERAATACKTDISDQVKGVYQLDLNGQETPARSAFFSENCIDSRVWFLLGQEMIASGKADRVIFMPIGTQETTMKDWLAGGRAQKKLQFALEKANVRNINFDYVFWQGGFSSVDFSVSQYQLDLQKVLKAVKMSSQVDKFIISASANCSGATVKHEPAYRWDPLVKRFSGPNISRLGRDYHADQCSFNGPGSRKMADLWLQAINEAEKENLKYQKESLLSYFKWKI